MPRVVHFEIHAGEPQRAMQFYEAVFGWQFTEDEGPEDYWYIKTGPDDEPGINGGIIRRKGELDAIAVIAFVCTVQVDSVDETAGAILENEGKLMGPKIPLSGTGWLIYCKDPEGNLFGILQKDPQIP